MKFLDQTVTLNNDTIAQLAEDAARLYAEQAGRRALPDYKIRFVLEEVLIHFRDTYGEESTCRIIGKKTLKQITYELRHAGSQADPIAPDDGMQLPFDILSRLDVRPRYQYLTRHAINSVIIPCETKPPRNKMLFSMLGAVALAVICCLVLRAVSPSVATMVFENLARPLFDKMTAVISALATPLVFLSVITGITGIGDISAFGKLGTKVCLGMGLSYLIAAVLLALIGGFAYPPAVAAAAEQGNVLGQIVQLVLDIVPDNLLMPFTIDNDLQVITVAIFTGAVMLIFGNRLRNLNGLVQDASNLINKMMSIVCRLLPLIVFLGIFNLFFSDMSEFSSIYRMVLLFLGTCALLVGITVLRVRIATGVPFPVIFKKTVPTLTINLATSSQVAALSENMHCCKDKFGIDPKMVDFALPLGIVVYMPCGALFLGYTALSLAVVSGTALPMAAFVKLVVSAVILAIAAPPIPGSAFTVLPILFAICGLPNDVYPLAIVIGTIIGYLLPAFNGFLLQMEMLLVAVRTGKIDKSRLQDPAAE